MARFTFLLLFVALLVGCAKKAPVPTSPPLPPVQPEPKPDPCTQTFEALNQAGISFDRYVMERYIANTGSGCLRERPVSKLVIREIDRDMYHSHAVDAVRATGVYTAGFEELVAYAKAHPNSTDNRGLIAPSACFRDRHRNVQCPVIRHRCTDTAGQPSCINHWGLDFSVMYPWRSMWHARTRFLMQAR